MLTISDITSKRMFLIAGLWNLSIGLTGLLFTDFSISLFFKSAGITSGFVTILMFRLFMTAVIIFGFGYYIVSKELMLNRGIIWLGLSSKIILFILFVLFFITEKATLIALLAVTGDFIWSLFFILFLYQSSHRVKINFIIG